MWKPGTQNGWGYPKGDFVAFLISILLLSSAIGCKPSHQQIVEPYLTRYDALRQKLQRVKNLIPADGLADTAPTTLDPALALIEDDYSDNTEAIMYEQLSDPDFRDFPFDLHLSDSLLTALHWTSEQRRNDDYNGGDAPFMTKLLDAGLALRYLIVHRAEELTLPQALPGGNEFVGGSVTLGGYVVDLQDEKIVAVYHTSATAADNVEFVYKETESPEERLKDFAISSMYTASRKRIAEKLPQATGGVIAFD